MDREFWKPLPNYSGYEISNFGRARSLTRIVHQKNGPRIFKGRILRLNVDSKGKGYLSFLPSQNGCQKIRIRIHVIVGRLFVPNPNNLKEINHKDGNPRNNFATNLEWVTHSQNQKHAIMLKLIASGERCSSAKLSRFEVIKIRKLGRFVSQRALAKRFGVSPSSICEIINLKRWRGVLSV